MKGLNCNPPPLPRQSLKLPAASQDFPPRTPEGASHLSVPVFHQAETGLNQAKKKKKKRSQKGVPC